MWHSARRARCAKAKQRRKARTWRGSPAGWMRRVITCSRWPGRSRRREKETGETMKLNSAILTILSGAMIASAQDIPPGGGRGGRGGQAAPPVASLSQRPSGSSLGTIRVGAADNNIWFGWRVGIPTAAFRQLSWSEALAKADTLGVASVEVSSGQKVSPEVPKLFDYRLQAGERAAILHRMRELNQQIGLYRVENAGPDESTRRKMFEFAKAVNA